MSEFTDRTTEALRLIQLAVKDYDDGLTENESEAWLADAQRFLAAPSEPPAVAEALRDHRPIAKNTCDYDAGSHWMECSCGWSDFNLDEDADWRDHVLAATASPQAASPHYHADGPWGTDEACWESHEAAPPGEGEHR